MRIKQLWPNCDIPANASLIWSRITFSRLTTAYFILSVLHCIIQVVLQGQAFSINATAAKNLWSLLKLANMTQEDKGFAILGDDLRICYKIPSSMSTESCQVVWGGMNQSTPAYGLAAASLSAPVNPVATSTVAAVAAPASSSPPVVSAANSTTSPLLFPTPVSSSVSSSPSRVVIVVRPTGNSKNVTTVIVQKPDNEGDNGKDTESNDRRRSFRFRRMLEVTSDVVNGTAVGVNVFGLHGDHFATDPKHLAADMNDVTTLSETCIKALIWPVQRLSDTKREDITLIGFQVWVLGMSLVALLNESIPHTVAALVTHMLATMWTVFQLFQTERFRQEFARLTTNGACRPNNLLGNYWAQRRNIEIPSAVFNGVVLLLSAFLTYKLIKIYGWQTFKRVGASLTINRVYKLVLSLSISIQLALFFIVAAMALWIDQLYSGSIGRLASLGSVYKAVFIVVFCLLIPWLSLGWFAVRREKRKLALVFLVLSLLFIGLWAAMFKSDTFRWTFLTWTFFTVMAVAAGTLMIATFVLGVACRFNFGKGLPRYLNAEEPLEGNDFTPVFPGKQGFGDDLEKVEFPTSNGRPVPTFSATFGRGLEVPKPTQMRFGPSHSPGMGVYNNGDQQHGHSVGRSISSSFEASLARTDTRSSQMTHNSDSSTSSGRTGGLGKRWVIE